MRRKKKFKKRYNMFAPLVYSGHEPNDIYDEYVILTIDEKDNSKLINHFKTKESAIEFGERFQKEFFSFGRKHRFGVWCCYREHSPLEDLGCTYRDTVIESWYEGI